MALGKFDDIVSAYKNGSPLSYLDKAGTTASVNQPSTTTGYGEENVSPLTKRYLAGDFDKTPTTPKQGFQSGDVGASFKGATEGLKGLYYGVKSLAQDALGNEEGFKESVKQFKESEAASQKATEGRVTSFKDVRFGEEGGVGRAIDYAQNLFGSAVPSILTSAASALIGGAIGGATGNAPGAIVGTVGGTLGKSYVQKRITDSVSGILASKIGSKLTKEAAEKLAIKKVNRDIGAGIGMLASGYAMGLGEVYNETRDEEGRGNILASFVTAIPYAALDAVTEIGVLKRLGVSNGGDKVLMDFAKAAAGTGLKEGATEAAQETALMLAGDIAGGKEYTSEEVLERLGNSFAGGFVAGGTMGGIGTAIDRTTQDPLGNAAEKAGADLRIKQREEVLNQDREQRLDKDADNLYKEFPQIKKLYAAGSRLAEGATSRLQTRAPDTPGLDKEREGFDTKIDATIADLEKIVTEKNDQGEPVASKLERAQAMDAINRLKSKYTTAKEQQRLDEEYAKSMAPEVTKQEIAEVTKEVTPEEVKPVKKTRGKKREETKQDAITLEQPEQVQSTQGQEPIQGQAQEGLLTPTPEAPVTAPTAVAEPTPTSPTAPVAEAPTEAPTAPQQDPLTQVEDRLAIIRQSAQKAQEQPVEASVVPTPTSTTTPVAEKPKRASRRVVGTKKGIAVDKIFTPLHAKSKDPVFGSLPTEFDQNPPTGSFKYDGTNLLEERYDGSWTIVENVPRKNRILKHAAVPKVGEQAAEVTLPSQQEMAAQEDEAAKIIGREKQAAKKEEERKAKQIEVPYTQEDLDYLVEKIKEARVNKKNKVKDNIKAELEERFGTRTSYKEFENMAMLVANGTIVPQQQQATAETTPTVETPTVTPEVTNDQENQTRTVQGSVGEGQELGRPLYEQEAGQEETPASGVLQEAEVKPTVEEKPFESLKGTYFKDEEGDYFEYVDKKGQWHQVMVESPQDTPEARAAARVYHEKQSAKKKAAPKKTIKPTQAEVTEASEDIPYDKMDVEELNTYATEEFTSDFVIQDDRMSNNDWDFNLTPYAEDMERQAQWLDSQAKDRGYTDIQDLLEKNINEFVSLSDMWREMNPDVAFRAQDFRQFVEANYGEAKPDRVAAIKNFERTIEAFKNLIVSRDPKLKIRIFLTGRDLVRAAEAENWTLNIEEKSNARNSKGYYAKTKNEVGIVLGNHFSVEDVKKTLLHETVGHRGIESLLGQEAWDRFMDRTWDNSPKIAEKAYATIARNYLGKKDSVTGMTKIPGMSQLTREQKRTLIKEYIAHLSEKWSNLEYGVNMDKTEMSFLKRVFAYIKHKLRSKVNWVTTERDIHELLQIAYRKQLGTPPGGTIPNAIVFKQAQEYNAIIMGENILSTPEGKIEIGKIAGRPSSVSAKSPQYQEAYASIEAGPGVFAAAIGEPTDNITAWQNMLNNDSSGTSFFSRYRRNAQKLNDRLEGITAKFFGAFGEMKGREQVKVRQRVALGDLEAIKKQTDLFAKVVWQDKNMTTDQHREIIEAWESGKVASGEFNPTWLNEVQKRSLRGLSDVLSRVQEKLVTGNYTNMPDDVRQKIIESKGKHIHRDYLNSLDKGYFGRGWLPSNLDWLKGRKVKGRQNQVERSGILDSKYAIVNTINLLGHDLAMLELQQNLVNDSENFNLNWVLPNYHRKITVGGENYTITQLDNRIKSLEVIINEQDTLKYTTEEVNQAKQDLVDLMKGLEELQAGMSSQELNENEIQVLKNVMWNSGGKYSKLDENGIPIQGTLQPISDVEAIAFLGENYTLIRERDFAGPLKYHYVDNRLYKVLVNESKQMEEDAKNWAGRMFGLGQGSMLSKATSYWKQHMTLGNLSYWPRAVMGSGFMMDMASDTNSLTLTKYVGQELIDAYYDHGNAPTYGNKKLFEHAVENGLFSSGFSTVELHNIRNDVRRKGGMEALKKELAARDVKSTLGSMFQVMTNGYYEAFKMLGDLNVSLDGAFKMGLFRDYLEVHAKSKGYKNAQVMANAYYKEDPAKLTAVMRLAAAATAKGIPEYHDVPGWVKTLRTVPLGGPFLTFNFKMFGVMQRAMIARPWKLAKYYMAAHLITQTLLEISDWDEDDLEEAMNNLPIHMQNKHSVFVLPFKGKDGNVHYADMSYTLPHSFIVDAFINILDPLPGETRTGAAWDSFTQTTGMFGGPIMTALTVLKSPNHTDPFTGRDLHVPGDSLENNLERYAKFAWNMSMPPWTHMDTFDVGTGGGIISDAFNANYKDSFGKDKNPFWSTDFASLSGINFKAYRPEDQAIKNRNYIGYKIRELQTTRTRVLKNVNLSRDEKIKSLTGINQKIKELMKRSKSI